jgi:hypothetical protein
MTASLVGLVFSVGVGVLVRIVGIEWATAWLILVCIATLGAAYESDDRCYREA